MSAARLGRPPGEVVEWLMAPVLKTGEVKASVGSNPTLSASSNAQTGPRRAGRLQKVLSIRGCCSPRDCNIRHTNRLHSELG